MKSKPNQLLDDWIDVLRTEQGRRVAMSVIEMSGFMRPGFTGQEASTLHNCGMQKVGHHVDQMCRDAGPELYIKMISEKVNG